MSQVFPAILERKVLPKVWGGRALETELGLTLPPQEAIGESWELYDRPGESSRLRGSEITLADLMRDHREDVLGRGVRAGHGGHFPLLVKYIDARERLSVQVHPGDEQAKEEDDAGKTEAWVVLHAGPQAKIVKGLRRGTTREEFEKVAASAAVEQHLASFVPVASQAVFVPWGTVHAVGPDVVLYEIQQNSDVTYRLWDWGRPRETHLAKGLRAIRYDLPAEATHTPEPIAGGGEWLVKCPLFRVRRFALLAPCVLGTEGSFKILSVLSGSGTVGWRSGGRHEPLLVRSGDTVLVPAVTGSVFVSPVGGLSILWADGGEEKR
jgi:mannose-6-phosphate isomerase